MPLTPIENLQFDQAADGESEFSPTSNIKLPLIANNKTFYEKSQQSEQQKTLNIVALGTHLLNNDKVNISLSIYSQLPRLNHQRYLSQVRKTN